MGSGQPGLQSSDTLLLQASGSAVGHSFNLSPGGHWPQRGHQSSSGNRNLKLFCLVTTPTPTSSHLLPCKVAQAHSIPASQMAPLGGWAAPHVCAAPGDVRVTAPAQFFSLVALECPQPQPQASGLTTPSMSRWAGTGGQEQWSRSQVHQLSTHELL